MVDRHPSQWTIVSPQSKYSLYYTKHLFSPFVPTPGDLLSYYNQDDDDDYDKDINNGKDNHSEDNNGEDGHKEANHNKDNHNKDDQHI